MTGTETLAYGYAWNNSKRDWTQRVEYLARDLSEARNWVRFNRDWMLNLGIEEQHDAHVFTWITDAF
jgi:hypothetical protein